MNRTSGSNSKPFVKADKIDNANADEVFKEVLKQLNISSSEKEKVNIALAAATAGAKHSEYEPSEDKTGKKMGRYGAAANERFWVVLQKFGLLLLITTLMIGLSQIFNFPMFRITKGGNEISPEDIEVSNVQEMGYVIFLTKI